ncbi:MAG: RagB/SusD family nutrient uptake outer membrane protein, partial [Sphingobacteriales bacterium]
GIYRANQVLDNVPNIEMEEALKTRLIGEAKFFRGFYYYQLALLFGKVPLMLKTSLPTDLPSPSSQSEVYDQAALDLTDATTALPPSYTGANLGRATAGAAHAMLAKVYMQQKKWGAAVTALFPIVEGPLASNYGLMTNYRDNFIAATENNRESVFEFQYATNPADNHDDDTDPRVDNLNYGSSIGRFIAPQPMGFADAQARSWVVNELLQESTITNQRDPRISASFLYANTDSRGPAFSMVYGQSWASRYPGGNSNIYFRKFLSDATLTTEVFNGDNNYRYLRYADVLLMYAECLNEVNRTADAYQYVDRVRQRVNLAPLSDIRPGLTKIPFLNQLKHERVTELSGEGHRWEDLARWGDLGPQLSSRDAGFATFEVGKHELFPLPQQDLDINPNMGASGQNPNY